MVDIFPNDPQYEDSNKNVITLVSEFTDDVYIYGKLYANNVGLSVEELENLTVGNFNVTGKSIFNDDVTVNGELDTDYLTVDHRLNVGLAGTVFTAISQSKPGQDQPFGRVGIGSTIPAGRFQVAVGGEGLDPIEPFDPLYSALIVTDDGAIGVGTTVPAGKVQIGYGFTGITIVQKDKDPSSDASGIIRVGIGTTIPDGKLQIGSGLNSFIVTDDTQNTGAFEVSKVGIGTTVPYGRFQIGSVPESSDTGDVFVVNSQGVVGLGILSPGNVPNYTPGSQGIIKINVNGSIKIDRNIIDSADSPGVNGYYLNRDGNGIRWVQASPLSLEGMYVQDESVYLPNNSAAQLYTTLNFRQENSAGVGTDTVRAIPDPQNPTMIARILSSDLWGHQGTGTNAPIYRMTKVGVNNNNPNSWLDVTGTLHVSDAVDFDTTLNVDGAVTFKQTLQVDQNTDLNANLDVDGAVTLNATLDVDGVTTLNNSVDVDGLITSNNLLDSTSSTTGSVQIDGGVGVVKQVNIGGVTKVENTTQSTDKDTGALLVVGGVGINKNLNVGENTKLIGTLELESELIDKTNDTGYSASRTKNDYRLSSSNTGVEWRPSGVETTNIIYVTKDGNDTNSGLLEGDAKLTIAAAAAIAQPGDTIKVRSGAYTEVNPIGLRERVTITGEDLRLVTVIPNNVNRDVFHVRNACLVENLNFSGTTISQDHPDCAAIAFPPSQTDIDAGTSFQAVSGYTAVGPANEGASGRYRSPYVRNCTNFMTGSIGMRINGDHVDAAYTGTNDLGQDLKSMVCDAFTQYNEAGIGVSITNNGYAQLVSIFTIGCDKGIFCSSGGQCDLTNSNSSFGNFGLVADGVGDVEFDGTLSVAASGESDKVSIKDCRDFNSPTRRERTPFDGQAAYFHLDMSQYNDVLPSINGTVTKPLQFIRNVRVTNGGNPGDYTASSPPLVTATLPRGPESIIAEFSPNVSAAGTITSIDVIASGRNFLPVNNDASTRDNSKEQECLITISGNGSATAEVDMDPILFTVDEATETPVAPDPNAGKTTITFNEFIPYAIANNTKIELVRMSRIITSSHSFEYIGAGTNINTANPFQGGKPVPENEVVAINGGQVPFTSTDQKGNFRIGDGLTIDQTTSTIRGRDFNRAIQAQLTPLILALR